LYVAANERKELIKTLSLAALLCIKGVVYAEARGESNEGKQGVAHVILNRSTKENRDVCRVANSSQFTRKKPNRSFRFSLGDIDPTGGATFFRNYPGPWIGRHFKRRIGNQYFYD
jgi:hypothetical protein